MKSVLFSSSTARTLRIDPPLSDAALQALCFENNAARIERTQEGVLSVNPPAGLLSSSDNADITSQLMRWWRSHRRGVVGDSSAGFYLPDGSMLSPDASYLTTESFAKLTLRDLRGFPHACPDFVIELLSTTDSLPKTKQKMKGWIANGAALGWLIHPRKKQVFIYEADKPSPTIATGMSVQGSGPVAGFELDLTEIWNHSSGKNLS